MTNNQSSRRLFLSSMAILTVGTAFGSVSGILPDIVPPADLKLLWKQFYLRQGGHATILQTETESVLPNKGHWYEMGSVILFPKQNMLAQPTWVYWSENKKNAADVIITFYENNSKRKKLFRLNRFEWEAFMQVPAIIPQQDIFAIMNETCQSRSCKSKSPSLRPLKVNVRKGREVSITARLSEQEISIHKKFIYSV